MRTVCTAYCRDSETASTFDGRRFYCTVQLDLLWLSPHSRVDRGNIGSPSRFLHLASHTSLQMLRCTMHNPQALGRWRRASVTLCETNMGPTPSRSASRRRRRLVRGGPERGGGEGEGGGVRGREGKATPHNRVVSCAWRWQMARSRGGAGGGGRGDRVEYVACFGSRHVHCRLALCIGDACRCTGAQKQPHEQSMITFRSAV